MNDRPLYGAAVYNPELLSKTELLRTFVARTRLLDRLLDDLRREDAGPPQHHLIVGRRGMGKSTLLYRLRYAVLDDPALSAEWVALTFPEEQYNVAHLSDFWLNCIDALADHLDRSGERAHLARLDAETERILRITEESRRRDEALGLLLGLAVTLQRRLILLVDNVDLVLVRLKKEEWSLREVLSTEPRLLLIGATAIGLESSYDYGAAFYDFFRVHLLSGLDEQDTMAVLEALAETHHKPEVAQLVREAPGRIRTLRLLAGGNPRTLTLLFNLWAQGIEGDVRSDLERLLDQCTPLYKHRFEDLPPQAQRVVDALALHWAPMTAADAARALNLEVNLVSAQLNTLVKRGEVEKVDLPDTRRTGFQISERFFNIWYLMRASRRARRRLVWLVAFLRLMYDPDALAERGRRLLAPCDEPGAGDSEYVFALAQAVDDGPTRAGLEHLGLDVLARVQETRDRLSELLDLEGHDAPLRARADRLRLLREAEQAVLVAKRPEPNWDPHAFWSLLGGSESLSPAEKYAYATGLLAGRKEHIGAVIAALEAERAGWAAWFDCPLGDLDALWAAQRGGHLASGRKAKISENRSALPEIAAAALHHGAPAILILESALTGRLGRTDASEVLRLPEPERAYRCWLTFAELCRGEPQTALRAFHEASILQPNLPEAWFGIGDANMTLNHYPAALTALERAQALGLDSKELHHRLGFARRKLNRTESAIDAYQTVVSRNEANWWTWQQLGYCYQALGQADARSLNASRIALANAPEVPEIQSELLNGLAWTLHIRGSEPLEAEALAQRALDLLPVNTAATHTLASILLAQDRWTEAEPHLRRLLDAPEGFLTAIWGHMLDLFAEMVRHRRAREAHALLASHAEAERWVPLVAALKGAAEGRRDSLGALAPEVRQAADLVLARIAPELGPPPS